jgi:hypothetical protein
MIAGYSLLQILMIVIAVAAAIAITVAAVRWMGLTIPPQAVMIFWIIVAAFVGIIALKFLFQIVGSSG